jgi:raffinose/stachyose/melibiose transport system permease protein
MTTTYASARGVLVPAQRRAGLRILKRLPLWIVIAVVLVIEIYPLVWLLISSFKTQAEFLGKPFWSLPANPQWSNYVDAFTTGRMGQYILNSAIAVVPSLALIIFFGVAAGFALQVMVFKGRSTLLLLFLAGVLIPGQMILLPLFTIYYQANLTGTLWPLIITYTASGMPLTVFFMSTYFRAIPREIFEASTLDGASIIRSYWSVGFPMVRNAVFTVGLVQFFFLWNDLLVALTFTNSQDLQTIQVGLLNFTGNFGQVAYGPLFAAICVSVFGTLIVYLVLNQRIMAGLTAGALKG